MSACRALCGAVAAVCAAANEENKSTEIMRTVWRIAVLHLADERSYRRSPSRQAYTQDRRVPRSESSPNASFSHCAKFCTWGQGYRGQCRARELSLNPPVANGLARAGVGLALWPGKCNFSYPSKEAAHAFDPLPRLSSTLRPLPLQRRQCPLSPILSPANCLFRIAAPATGPFFWPQASGFRQEA